MSASAKRHAQAVFQIARDSNATDKWRSDLEEIVQTLSHATLVAILENPKIRFEQKRNMLGQIFPDINKSALNLLYLLTSKKRLQLLKSIQDYYGHMVDDHKRLEHAQVTSAIPLDRQEQEDIGRRLAALQGKKVIVTNDVDPSIIGGFIARIGDRVIDGSVRARLNALKKTLEERTAV